MTSNQESDSMKELEKLSIPKDPKKERAKLLRKMNRLKKSRTRGENAIKECELALVGVEEQSSRTKEVIADTAQEKSDSTNSPKDAAVAEKDDDCEHDSPSPPENHAKPTKLANANQRANSPDESPITQSVPKHGVVRKRVRPSSGEQNKRASNSKKQKRSEQSPTPSNKRGDEESQEKEAEEKGFDGDVEEEYERRAQQKQSDGNRIPRVQTRKRVVAPSPPHSAPNQSVARRSSMPPLKLEPHPFDNLPFGS